MRVTLGISYIEAVFDFKDVDEAVCFAENAKKHFNPDKSEREEIKITMTFIPDDEIKQIGGDDDE